MKRISALTLLVAAGFLTAGSAMAQQKAITADIPFNFNLNGRTLPAGHYTVESDFNTPNVLRLEDRKDSVHVIVMARPDTTDSQQRDNTIAFHKYGNEYFISSIRSVGSAMNCHLVPSKQEKWARAQKQEAALLTNNDVVIALN